MACRLKQGNLNSWPVGLERSTGGAPHFPSSQGRKHAHNRYGEEYSYTGQTSSTFIATLSPRHLTFRRPSLERVSPGILEHRTAAADLRPFAP